jgi:hypothetical protein
MWPQDRDKSCYMDGPAQGFDYYCLDAWNPQCCWLNSIFRSAKEDTKEAREPLTRPYFQQMSEAMASTCSGDVYTYCDDTEALLKQPMGQPESIWLTHELPMLRQRRKRNLINDLWAIPTLYTVGNKVIPQYDRSHWVRRTGILDGLNARDIEVDELLARRFKEEKERLRNPQPVQDGGAARLDLRWQTCNADNAAREGAGQDWFG